MAELPPEGRSRVYRVRWPGETRKCNAWAEKFFDNHDEAFHEAAGKSGHLVVRR